MATVKVTVTLPAEQVAAIKALVTAGAAPSVSGFVTHAVGVGLDDVAGWHRALDEALAASGGPLTDEERSRADEVLSGPSAA